MIKGRDLSNLSANNDGEKALNNIIKYFGIEYLTNNKQHSLPRLWARPDRLATVELYILGMCLDAFDESNQKWLKDTIRRIKSELPRNATGLFTEIIFFGYFNLQRSIIIPAKSKNPGYDFSIEFPNKNKQYVSIKNIDISDAQNAFLSN